MPRPLGRAEQREKFDEREPDDRVRNIMFEQSDHAGAILSPRRQLSVNFTLAQRSATPHPHEPLALTLPCYNNTLIGAGSFSRSS